MNEDTKKLIIGGVGMLTGVVAGGFILSKLFTNSASAEQVNRLEKEVKRAHDLAQE